MPESLNGLLNNAVLLLALGVLYELFLQQRSRFARWGELLAGLGLGVLLLAVMINPFVWSDGLVFDTRTIILSNAGLFLGPLSTLIAALIAATYRLYLGGVGAWAGVASIVVAAGAGLAWRWLRGARVTPPTFGQLWLFGVVVHVGMLACMAGLPSPLANDVLTSLSVPVLLIYPVLSAILGGGLIRQQVRQQQQALLREREQALASALRDQDATLQAIPDPLFELDAHGVFVDYRVSQEAHLPMSPDQFLGRSLEQVLPVEVARQTRALLAQADREGSASASEMVVPLSDKVHVYDISVVVKQLLDLQAERHYLVVARDVSERVEALQAKRASEQRLGTAVRESPFPTMIYAEDGEVLAYSRSWLEESGYAREQISTLQDWLQCAYGHQLQDPRRGLDQLYAQGSRQEDGEFELRRADGEIRIWALSSTPMGLHEDGRRLVLTMAVDVTERRRSEQEIERVRQRLDMATRCSGVGVWEAALPSGLLTIDGRMVDIYQLPPGTQTMGQAQWEASLHPEDRDRVIREIHEQLEQEQAFHLEHRIIRADGEVRDIQAHAVALLDEQGNMVRLIGVNWDITPMRRVAAANAELSRRLQKIADRVSGMLYQYRLWPDGRSCFPYVSERIREIYELTPEQVVDDAGIVFEHLHPDDREAVSEAILTSAQQLTPWRQEYRMIRQDGSVRWLKGSATPERDADGSTLWHGFITDITEQKEAELELSIAAIAFESQEGMLVTDNQARILRVNKTFTEVTGYSAEEAQGQTPAMLKSGRQDPSFYHRMWAELRERGVWQGEVWNRRKNGELYAEWLMISAVRDPRGRVTNYVGCFTDITQRKEAEAEIHHLAFYDVLTGLANRRLLLDRLHHALTLCQRHHSFGAVFFIDMDNFKTLNDTRGHDVGDELLCEVAKRLNSAVRDSDTVARLGGDEFLVMLEELGEDRQLAADHAATVARKVQQLLAQPYELFGHRHHSTPSIGVSLFCSGSEGVEEVLKQADVAMYQAKNGGRNQVCFFDPATQQALDAKAVLLEDLRSALLRDELSLFLQGQFDGDCRLQGAEVLLRWQHPERGFVPPDQFIPLAEESGLIVSLGHWVLQQALIQLRQWQAQASTAHLTLAVNVSARQLQQVEFVDQLQALLVESGVDPHGLKLEITESMVISNLESTLQRLQAVRDLGVSFSMDDFGTGYSSLSQLKRLPLDQVKIDRTFINDLTTSSDDAAIVRAIISMAHSLELQVVAEGVETVAQMEHLDALGCDTYQGYLLARPMAQEAFAEVSAEWL